MRGTPCVEQQHTPARLQQVPRRPGPEYAGPDDDDVFMTARTRGATGNSAAADVFAIEAPMAPATPDSTMRRETLVRLNMVESSCNVSLVPYNSV